MKIPHTAKHLSKKIWIWNVRTKFFMSYALVLFAALVILGSYAYVQAKNQIRYNLESTVNIVLQNECQEIEKVVSQCTTTMMNILRNRSLYAIVERGYQRERDGFIWPDMENVFIPTMNSFQDSNEYIDQLTMYTVFDVPEQGVMLLDESRIEDTDWYRQTRDAYGIHWFFQDGTLFAAWELRNLWSKTEQAHVGTLYLRIQNTIFTQKVTVENGETYYLKLLDANRTIIFPAEETELKMIDDKTVQIGNQAYIYRERGIQGLPWKLAVFAPSDTAYHGLNNIFFMTLAMIVGCLVLFGLPGVFFSLAITENIRKLSYAMNEIGSGNLDVEIDIKPGDEIGIIAGQMEKMLSRLKETIQTLYQTTIDKQQLELKTLQAQINPHFLYNALSTMKWTAMEENADSTAYIAEQLSEFYRTSLNSGKTMITFENELRNAKAYISMELMISDNGFDVTYEIDETIYPYFCINFILQPVIENAIFHGIKTRQDNDRGCILLAAHAVGETIVVSVTDNGPGISSERIEGILKGTGKGYGLGNIQSRIQLTFGKEYGVHIKSDASGTCVTLTLPKLQQGEWEQKEKGENLI